MNIHKIEKQLLNVYPTGSVYEPNIGALIPHYYHDLVYKAISRIIGECKVDFADRSKFYDVRYSFEITLKKIPENQKLLQPKYEVNKKWLLENNNQYPYLLLEISRVWPGYLLTFNSFSLREGKEWIDFNTLSEPPDDEWKVIYEKVNEILLAIPDMTRFIEEDLSIVMQNYFHETYDYDDDDNENPVREPATLKLCLF